LHTVVIGDGPLRRTLERTMRVTDSADAVTLLGAADPTRIRSVLAASDVYVAPAVRESFGIAALEARSAGLPVVCFASSGITDFITHGKDGLLVEDDNAMARAIASLAVDPALLRRLQHHSRSIPPAIEWQDALAGADALYARVLTAPLRPAEPLPATAPQ
jgi:glycosyltransferase involved in cell wall biosynthesis